MKRHIWRSHDKIDCKFCGLEVENRHDLKRHKTDDHKMTRTPSCKFYEQGRCVDAEECLYNHEATNQTIFNNISVTGQPKICKKGLKCQRDVCDIPESGHLKISQVLCKYQENCNVNKCPFKHTVEKSDFYKFRRNNRKL